MPYLARLLKQLVHLRRHTIEILRRQHLALLDDVLRWALSWTTTASTPSPHLSPRTMDAYPCDGCRTTWEDSSHNNIV